MALLLTLRKRRRNFPGPTSVTPTVGSGDSGWMLGKEVPAASPARKLLLRPLPVSQLPKLLSFYHFPAVSRLGGCAVQKSPDPRIPLIFPLASDLGSERPLVALWGFFVFPLFLLGSSLCNPLVPDWGGLGSRWGTDRWTGGGGGSLVNMPRGAGHGYCHSGC